jgi:hypothetical protein
LLALLDQPTFGIDSLPPLPVGLSGFTVLSADFARTYDQIVTLLKLANPPAAERIPALEEAIRRQFGLDLRQDLLARLGPKLSIYTQPPAADAGANRAAFLVTQFSGLTVTAQVRDEAVVSRALGPLMKMVNRMLAEVPAGRRRNPPLVVADTGLLEFRKSEGPRPAYIMDVPLGILPPPFGAMFRPAVMLSKEQLVLSASADVAEQAVALSGGRLVPRWQPAGAFLSVVRRLPANLVYLNLSDTRNSLPALVEALPILAQQMNMQGPRRRRIGANGVMIVEPSGPLLQIDPDKLPRADELIRFLFPSSTAVVVDEEAATLVAREAFPSLNSPSTVGILVGLL